MAELLDMINNGVQASRFLVNLFPSLKYLPAWMPGASFQEYGRRGRELGKLAVEGPFDKVKREIVSAIILS